MIFSREIKHLNAAAAQHMTAKVPSSPPASSAELYHVADMLALTG